MATVNWMIDQIPDAETDLGVNVLEHILIWTPASPLRIVMPEFSLELLQAINDWQSGGDHKQKVRRGAALKAVARDLPAEFRTPPSVCYRQEAHEKDRVWKLLAENKLPETIASWTSSFDVARDFKGGVPPEPLKGVIFRFAPRGEQVIVNLDALYADPTFRNAIDEHKKNIKRYSNGIGKYQGQQIAATLLV